jgi:CubicO group peptidase (beta-lactamase class C family)
MGIIGFPPGMAREWRRRDPEFAGFRPGMGEQLDRDMAGGAYPGLHGLLIIRRGSLVLERYFGGEDEIWGEPLGHIGHGPHGLHDIRSVTKSIVSLLYGIALDQGLVPPTAARIIDQFPRYPDLAGDPLRRRMTIAHALSMRLGISWHEDFAYADPANGERQMEAAADRYRNILERPVVHRPGSTWTYCGGAAALLGHIIAKGVATRLELYAGENLFGPLGITEFEWINGSGGEAAASSGLRLRPRDLAKLGQLVLDQGQWDGRQIVPKSWLTLSFKPRADVEKGLKYGYQWWLGKLISNGKPWYGAFGNGGQRLLVIPSLDMAVVIVAGNYNREDQWKMPVKLMSKLVIASLMKD